MQFKQKILGGDFTNARNASSSIKKALELRPLSDNNSIVDVLV
jgi:hypothetical protein